MIKIYGISNCDKIKKIKSWMKNEEIEFSFQDYKKNPPHKELLKNWFQQLGEYPINKRGTTYRKLKNEIEKSDDEELLNIIISNPSLLKRPITEKNLKILSIGEINPQF